MSLVRVELPQGRTAQQVRALADVVQACMEGTAAAPSLDRCQVVTHHEPRDSMVGRSGEEPTVRVHVHQDGRTPAQKQALYDCLRDHLQERCGVAETDLLVVIADVDGEDWRSDDDTRTSLSGAA